MTSQISSRTAEDIKVILTDDVFTIKGLISSGGHSFRVYRCKKDGAANMPADYPTAMLNAGWTYYPTIYIAPYGAIVHIQIICGKYKSGGTGMIVGTYNSNEDMFRWGSLIE